ncbi:C6 transcription factor [Sporothrix schenckii 1099-18]|uniref:C6 transcription factor n=1 Tax=Sporothrix schenckii 1099-18 TaxID=1397361 RepID=A0A0F2MGR8_SPOSC|nr:C6 transcription factor [Sporothrix schenckii 1099-18]KJR88025.1 C6 transcription factor [Sporothrix schenckii 1099-18]
MAGEKTGATNTDLPDLPDSPDPTPPRQRQRVDLERPHKIRKTHGDIHGDIHGSTHGHVERLRASHDFREDTREAATSSEAAISNEDGNRSRIPSSEDLDLDPDLDSLDQDQSHRKGEGVPTTTPRKRTRDMDQKISCELCKTRKVKCDRAEPACSWCARHNRQCVYLKRQTPGSRTRINAELEAKVNRIDSLLRALGRRVEEHISQDHAADFERRSAAAGSGRGAPGSSNDDGVSPSLGSPTAAGSSIFRGGDDDAHSNANSGTPNASTGNSNSNGNSNGNNNNNQTPGAVALPPPMTSSGMSMIWQSGGADYDDDASTLAGGGLQPYQSQHRYAPPSTPFRTPKPPTAELPPNDMLYTLVDLFFKHCNTWCPILDRKTIFGTFFGATSLEEPDRVLLHAIVATTLRFSKDARLTPEAREYYHTSSSQVVRLYAMDHITVPALRALVIVSLDEFGTSSGPRAWNLLAMVAQNVRQLGLCDEVSVYLAPSPVDLEQQQQQQQQQQQAAGDSDTNALSSPGPRPIHQSKPDSWIEDEGRRRLCWVVYLLDRYATVCAATTTSLTGAGGGFLLDDAAMHRFLPCSYDLFSRNVPVETRSSYVWSDLGSEYAAAAGTPHMPHMPHMPPSTPLSETASSMANKAEHLGSFSYHCKLLRILSRIHDFLRQPVDINSSADMARWRNTYQALDATLDGWLRGLPSEFSKISALCHSDPASRVANWFMLHSAYVTAVVRLHAPAAYPTARSTLFMPSQYAVQRCLSAVHSLADIARDLREANGLDLLGPPFAFSLWIAARVLLVHASVQEAPGQSAVGGLGGVGSGGGNGSAAQPLDSHARIDFFIETLRHVGRHWAVANHYAATLARVAQRGRQGQITFSNMRRSAYDLLALTSTSRQSGAEPMSTQVTSLCELDNIDVFSFFVYPRMVDDDDGSTTARASMSASVMAPSMAPSMSSLGNTSNPGSSIGGLGMNNVLRTPMPPSVSMLPGSPHRGSSVF